jgi:predicted ATP-binding protein involved in virulence
LPDEPEVNKRKEQNDIQVRVGETALKTELKASAKILCALALAWMTMTMNQQFHLVEYFAPSLKRLSDVVQNWDSNEHHDAARAVGSGGGKPGKNNRAKKRQLQPTNGGD